MLLLIDTSDHNLCQISLIDRQIAIHKFQPENLSEKLLPEIKKILKKNKISFQQIRKVEVRTGQHFSRTRTTVAVANALIYALKLKQQMFKPTYNREPNITLSKK